MTWIPIHQMPEEWRDGRWVLFGKHGTSKVASAKKMKSKDWWNVDGRAEVEKHVLRYFTHCAEIPPIPEGE